MRGRRLSSAWLLPRLALVLCTVSVVLLAVFFLRRVGLLTDLPYAKALNSLTALIAALVSLLTALGALLADKVSSSNQERELLLNNVDSFWIRDVLGSSLHSAAPLELRMTSSAKEVKPTTSLQRSRQPDRDIPVGIKIMDVFNREAQSALLILGEPGSGKTTTLLQLADDLIKNLRQSDKSDNEPMPAVFNLSRWVQMQRPSIDEWLIEELRELYEIEPKVGEVWVHNHMLIPLLDGLDEVGQEHQEECVKAINHFRDRYKATRIAVCSRTADYRALDLKLDLKGAIILQPLTLDQVEDYLAKSVDRVMPVWKALQEDKNLRELARTPLVLDMMRLVLLGEDVDLEGGTIEARRVAVFDAYVNRMLEEVHRELQRPQGHDGQMRSAERRRVFSWYSRPRTKRKYELDQAKAWLSWLARTMRQSDKTSRILYLEEIQPHWLSLPSELRSYTNIFRVVNVLILGLAISVLAMVVLTFELSPEWMPNWAFWIVSIFFVCIVVPVVMFGSYLQLQDAAQSEISIRDVISWSWPRGMLREILLTRSTLYLLAWSQVIVGAICLYRIVVVGDPIAVTLLAMPITLIGLVTVVGIYYPAYVAVRGFSRTRAEKREFPNQGIRRQTRNAIVIGISAMLLSALLLRLLLQANEAKINIMPETLALWLMPGAVAVGAVFIWGGFDCIKHYTIRWVLWRHRHMPWDYPAFLDYCRDCVILQRVGGGYRFINELLQDHLAKQSPEEENRRNA